jgi:transcriptional regulator with XRE-family HTH domain
MIETLKQAQAALNEILFVTGWSQREVARRCNIAPATICRILSGRITQTPSAENRASINELLEHVQRTVLCDMCNGTGIIASVGPCPVCRAQPDGDKA